MCPQSSKLPCEGRYLQAEARYNAAAALRPSALQPHHGLAQLYRRSRDARKLAATLEHILTAAALPPENAAVTRQQLARAYLDAGEPRRAAEAVGALVRELRLESPAGSDGGALPPEVVVLQADAQLALDAAEYEARLAARLAQPHSGVNNVRDSGPDAAVAQEVGASWVRRCHHAPRRQWHSLDSPRGQQRGLALLAPQRVRRYLLWPSASWPLSEVRRRAGRGAGAAGGRRGRCARGGEPRGPAAQQVPPVDAAPRGRRDRQRAGREHGAAPAARLGAATLHGRRRLRRLHRGGAVRGRAASARGAHPAPLA
jgi:hypothetical protein